MPPLRVLEHVGAAAKPVEHNPDKSCHGIPVRWPRAFFDRLPAGAASCRRAQLVDSDCGTQASPLAPPDLSLIT